MTTAPLDADLVAAAEAARGFMPTDEGQALADAAWSTAATHPGGTWLEVGTWCGKSSIWLGAAARVAGDGTVLFTVDHHRGSEENQAGWEHHDAALVDAHTGRLETLPEFRRNMWDAGLDDVVIAVVGDSPTVARHWSTPLAFLFIDGGHGAEPARADHDAWTPHVAPGGLLAIHDVFSNPVDGGQAPHDEIYRRALDGGRFVEERAVGSLRVLRRV